MEERVCLVLAFLAMVGCVAGAGGMPANEPLRPGQWILVQAPPKGELAENTFPPSSNFRVDMMWDAQSVASRAMLEEVSSLHCVPAAKLAAPVTGASRAR
jgi:hypothetical protein